MHHTLGYGVLFIALLATPAFAGDSDAAGQQTASEVRLAVGDRLRLDVFEKVELDEDRWSRRKRANLPDQSLFPRQDLSGEFIVQPDGSVPVPLIGNVPAADKSAAAVAAAVAAKFLAETGHNAQVTYSLVERQPVSIVGPVRQPGVYRFAPGMSVLHLVALAGGYKTNDDSWSKVEGARQAALLGPARERYNRAFAELQFLRGERDGLPRETVLRNLRAIPSEDVAEARSVRERAKQTMAERREALAAGVAAARDVVSLGEQRVKAAEQVVVNRRERVGILRKLADAGSLGKPVLLQATVELSDSEDRRLAAVGAVSESKLRLSTAMLEASRYELDMRAELDRLIAQRTQEAADARATVETSQAVGAALATERELMSQMEFRIVRKKDDGGWVAFNADQRTPLEPGDLVQFEQARDQNVANLKR